MTNTLKGPTRVGWIDVLKGIGILSVVAGHIFPLSLSKYLYIFHMPLFFFIGGFLYKPTDDSKEFLSRKSFQLLVPYVTFLLLIYVPCEISEIIQGKETMLQGIARPLLGGRYLVGWCAVFWYITCFFLVQQVMNILMNTLKENVVALLMLLCLLVSYAINILAPHFWLPWNADVIPAALPWFYLGYKYQQHAQKIAVYKVFWFILAAGALVLTYFYPGNTYFMKTAGYGIPFITLFSSLFIILSLVEISKMLGAFPLASKPLGELGKASLVIMYLHQPVQLIALEHFHIASPVWRFLIALVVSVTGYYLLNGRETGRAFCLGSLADFRRIFIRSKLETAEAR